MNLGHKRTLQHHPLVHAAAFDRKGYSLPWGSNRKSTRRLGETGELDPTCGTTVVGFKV